MIAKIFCRGCGSFYADIEWEGTVAVKLLCTRCNARCSAVIAESRPPIAKAIADSYYSD